MERRAPRRPVDRPVDRSNWVERNWVSVVGLSLGVLVSLWRFGFPHLNPVPAGGPFPMAEFHWHGTVTPGHQIQIRGMNGAVHAVATNGNEVEVTALRRSSDLNPADVPVAVIQQGGDVTVCGAQPGAPNDCAGGSGRGAAVNIEYQVHVPKGVVFAARSVNGAITASGLAGGVEAETVNGAIDLSTSGTARAETVNGSIRASVGSTGQDLSFRTVNGSIAVTMPENASTDVRAETVRGSINSEFPLTIRHSRPSRSRSATGRIGSGGHQLRMETVNGSILLRKATNSSTGEP
jgi:hypothetical protein